LKTTGCISTLSAATQGILQFTLIDVTTYFARCIHFVPIVADTPIRPHQIFTCAIDANVGVLGAFIDIYNNNYILRLFIELEKEKGM